MTQIHQTLFTVARYLRPKQDCVADHVLSAVHYKLAFSVILSSAILTGLTSWYSPINCMKPTGNEFSLSYVEQWCYANSTYIVYGPTAELGIAYGIVNKYSDGNSRVVYINYYQWITLALLLHAASFQVPRVLWNNIEGGRVRKLVQQLHELEAASFTDRALRIARLADRFCTRPYVDSVHYAKWFSICQILYLINVIAQITFAQCFLNGHFVTLMPRWLAGQPVLDAIFPKTVKCDLLSYGSGGSVNMLNVLCVLSMNVLNEKIYLFLWVLLVLALATATAQVVYVGMTMSSRRLRNTILRIDDATQCDGGSRYPNQDPKLSQGEWLMLAFVKDNLNDSGLFDDFINGLAVQRLGFGDVNGNASGANSKAEVVEKGIATGQ